jgi:hypothetical protein
MKESDIVGSIAAPRHARLLGNLVRHLLRNIEKSSGKPNSGC